VLLIHGVWSSAQTWDYFYPLVQLPGYDSRFNVTRLDYSATSAQGFGLNAAVVLPLVINAVQQFKVASSVAAVQADIVAHSMGGNVVRAFAAASYFRRAGNFLRGDVHKLITIDTPYAGSQLAANLLNSTPVCRAFWGGVLGRTVAGAVADLATGSGALAALQTAGLPFPVHAIAGAASSEQASAAESSAAMSVIELACWRLDPNLRLLGPTGTFEGVFGGASDLIVSQTSQQPTASLGIPSTLTNYPGIVHSVDSSLFTNGPDALSRGIANSQYTYFDSGNGQLVIELLNTSVQSTAFGPRQP
jgi:pimeloyl-ACP methyl ester carboxylesterase